MKNCVHHWILEGSAPFADSLCKNCGTFRHFTGGWSKDDMPVDKNGKS